MMINIELSCAFLLSNAGINVLSDYFVFLLSQQEDYVLTHVK